MATRFLKENAGWVIALVSLIITLAALTVNVTWNISSMKQAVLTGAEDVWEIKDSIKPGVLPVAREQLSDHERRLDRLERIVLFQNRSLLQESP